MSDQGEARVPSWFQWNFYGWFGGLIGFSGMLLASAVVLIPRAPLVAAIWFGCGAAIVAAGFIFWHYRARVHPYWAVQSLILVWWASMAVAFWALEKLNPGITDIAGWQWKQSYLLLTPPILLTVFAMKERAMRGRL